MASAIILLAIISAVFAAPQFPEIPSGLPGSFSGMIPPIPGANGTDSAGGEEAAESRAADLPGMPSGLPGGFSGMLPIPGGNNGTESSGGEAEAARIGELPSGVPQLPADKSRRH